MILTSLWTWNDGRYTRIPSFVKYDKIILSKHIVSIPFRDKSSCCPIFCYFIYFWFYIPLVCDFYIVIFNLCFTSPIRLNQRHEINQLIFSKITTRGFKYENNYIHYKNENNYRNNPIDWKEQYIWSNNTMRWQYIQNQVY